LKNAAFTKGQSQRETAICSAAIDLSEFETTYKSTSYTALNPPKALNQDAQVKSFCENPVSMRRLRVGDSNRMALAVKKQMTFGVRVFS
jgi:hypothetical protein